MIMMMVAMMVIVVLKSHSQVPPFILTVTKPVLMVIVVPMGQSQVPPFSKAVYVVGSVPKPVPQKVLEVHGEGRTYEADEADPRISKPRSRASQKSQRYDAIRSHFDEICQEILGEIFQAAFVAYIGGDCTERRTELALIGDGEIPEVAAPRRRDNDNTASAKSIGRKDGVVSFMPIIGARYLFDFTYLSWSYVPFRGGQEGAVRIRYPPRVVAIATY